MRHLSKRGKIAGYSRRELVSALTDALVMRDKMEPATAANLADMMINELGFDKVIEQHITPKFGCCEASGCADKEEYVRKPKRARGAKKAGELTSVFNNSIQGT